ncbi:MAG: pentapeptide repeat-containing protein [Syntrophobacteraceae bacterium]|nr:pentapeptide repeat-containing protein [Syntrophobacteraceae bacterium]
MSELERYQILMAVISGRGPAFLRGVNLTFIDLSGAGWLADADLRGADLESANLKRANLRGANLEKANLYSANLSGARLEGANLFAVKANVANLSQALLRGANMKEASLIGANLVKADLEEVDLDGADLEGANLEGSNLRRARITNVNLKMTNLEGADLTEAIMDCSNGLCPEKDGDAADFHGTITAIRLTDLLQIGCLSRSNLKIEVNSKDSRGEIYTGSGKVLHAHTSGLEGEAALMKILGWEKGRFAASPALPAGRVTIDKPVEHLVFQWRRIEDEKLFSEPESDPLALDDNPMQDGAP